MYGVLIVYACLLFGVFNGIYFVTQKCFWKPVNLEQAGGSRLLNTTIFACFRLVVGIYAVFITILHVRKLKYVFVLKMYTLWSWNLLTLYFIAAGMCSLMLAFKKYQQKLNLKTKNGLFSSENSDNVGQQGEQNGEDLNLQKTEKRLKETDNFEVENQNQKIQKGQKEFENSDQFGVLNQNSNRVQKQQHETQENLQNIDQKSYLNENNSKNFRDNQQSQLQYCFLNIFEIRLSQFVCMTLHILLTTLPIIDLVFWFVLIPYIKTLPPEKKEFLIAITHDFCSYNMHAFNAILLFSDLFLNQIEFSLHWMGSVACWSSIYGIFVQINFFMTGKWLYFFLDYNKPGGYLAYLILLTAHYLCYVFVYASFLLRDYIFKPKNVLNKPQSKIQ